MALPTLEQILGANHYETAAIIALAVILAAVLVDVGRRLRGEREEERPAEPAPVARPSFWRRVAVEMDRAESTSRYGNLVERLNGWPALAALCAMPVAAWAIHAVVPALSVPVLYTAFVLTAAVLGYYAFRYQPNLDVHVLLLHLLTAVLVWGLVNGEARWQEVGPALSCMAAAMLFFQALARSRQPRQPRASRWSRPAAQAPVAKVTRRKPESVMALVSLGLQLVVAGAIYAGAIPAVGLAAALPLVGVVPWLLSHLIERGQSYQAPPLRAPGVFLPIEPVAWLLRVVFGSFAHVLLPSRTVTETKPSTPEPEAEGGLGVVLFFLAGRVAPMLLLCGGQWLLWQGAQAVRAQAALPIHLFLAGAVVLICLAAALVGIEVKSASLRKAAADLSDYGMGHGPVAARAVARNFSVLSLLVLPILGSSLLSGAWRQSAWPWLYFAVIVAGMVAMRREQPNGTPTPETKAFRAAGGR